MNITKDRSWDFLHLFWLAAALLFLLLAACSAPSPPGPSPAAPSAEQTAAATQTITPTATRTMAATGTPTIAPSPTNSPVPTPTPECTPTDQDQYVYSPERLQVMADCIHVTGYVVDTAINQQDGDGLFGMNLDPPYKHYLNQANYQAYKGALHLEIVCYVVPSRLSIRPVCVGDPDPLRAPLPKVGQHLWVEGRWVLDVFHEGYSELHPVYRWGVLP